jgi:hypothetical protein
VHLALERAVVTASAREVLEPEKQSGQCWACDEHSLAMEIPLEVSAEVFLLECRVAGPAAIAYVLFVTTLLEMQRLFVRFPVVTDLGSSSMAWTAWIVP